MRLRHFTLLLCLLAGAFQPALRGAEPDTAALLAGAREAWLNDDREEAIQLATQMIESDPRNPNAYFLRARFHEMEERRAEAVADYTAVLGMIPQSDEATYARAVQLFLLGRIDESLADFDRLVERNPQRTPHLWQRGIALYFGKRHEDGRKQFELHQTVNGADVENAVWHFLCVNRLEGFAAAREKLIPITGDPRVPMTQVHRLFEGTGTADEVLAAAREAKSEIERLQQLNFAHLYLALFYEATGERAKRREHLQKAVDLNLRDNYMWETARVHLELVKSGRLE